MWAADNVIVIFRMSRAFTCFVCFVVAAAKIAVHFRRHYSRYCYYYWNVIESSRYCKCEKNKEPVLIIDKILGELRDWHTSRLSGCCCANKPNRRRPAIPLFLHSRPFLVSLSCRYGKFDFARSVLRCVSLWLYLPERKKRQHKKYHDKALKVNTMKNWSALVQFM